MRELHGMRHDPRYGSWAHMKERCTNPQCPKYPEYGGRGITVCDRWRDSFTAFAADMGPRPSRSHSIERIDNNGHYTPDNCRWANHVEQGANKRNNCLYTFNGETRHLSEWARTVGLPYFTLRARLRKGWAIERTLTEPINVAKRNRRHARQLSSSDSTSFRPTP